MKHILFIRGMNSSGDNTLRLGPFTFGPMHAFWESAIRAAGHQFTAINGLGTGLTDELVPRAQREVHQIFQTRLNTIEDYVLVGHSQGGLVSRILVHNPNIREKIKTVVTVGTPHHGAWLAEAGMKFAKLQALFPQTPALLNRQIVISSLTTDKMKGFNANFPAHSGVRYASVLTTATHQQRSLPLKFLAPLQSEPSDGIVNLSSQSFGDTLGPFKLDHLAQLGYSIGASAKEKNRVAEEFNRMIAAILNWV
jgi:pimeloyl-ACP methyl ester carboxylesterase